LRHFKQGKICELYEEAHLVQSKTPKQQAENNAAQAVADVDNFKSANASHQACSSGSYQSRQHSCPGKLQPPSLQVASKVFTNVSIPCEAKD
jgi:hypothetical protein